MHAGFDSRKSSTGSTIPLPIRWNHTRLTTDLLKNALSAEVSHFASTARRSSPVWTSASPVPMYRGFIWRPVRGWLTSPSRELNTTSAPGGAFGALTPGSGLVFTRANHAAMP